MSTDNRFALDAAAVVQQLSREIAGMQARAVAQRALIEAAASLQRPDICERAATEVQIYEDAAARLLQRSSPVSAQATPCRRDRHARRHAAADGYAIENENYRCDIRH